MTASPVLTNEVKQFYGKIGDHIKEKLRERDEKLVEKLKNKEKTEINEDKLEEFEDIEESIAEAVKYEEEFGIDEGFEEESSEEEVQGPVSLEFMRDEDFPLFATVRKIIFMVDAAMKRPFFARNKEGNVIGSSSKFQWHNEMKGALVINREYKLSRQEGETVNEDFSSSGSDSDLEIDIEAQSDIKKSKKNVVFKHRLNERHSLRAPSYEVDFSIFASKFYPKVKGHCPYTAVLLWTEISAYIKGSATSFKYPGYYLPLANYMNMGRKVSMLTHDDKFKIWSLFIEYERWKHRENAYDMQDVVNYLLNQVVFYGYVGVPIHYMMVDEVQDLTSATLYLLLQITDKQLFFSGDTAQTIAKGVGFRFCDLKGLFAESKLAEPTICQLTVNFRTHNQILGLANSIVALLETLFPLTIDKMAKEISNRSGPLPTVLKSDDINDLIYFVFGTLDNENSKSNCEFGCNQVIIVRNQESKEKLPQLLKHALCLTVYEAKGLEFDDVILFNFFAESEVPPAMWNKLRNIQKREEADSKTRPQNFEDLDQSVPKLSTDLEANNPEYSALCSDLKHLYVAVTRPKHRLIIFDDDHSTRRFIESYLTHMSVIEFAETTRSPSGELIITGLSDTFAKKTGKPEWRAQGLRMFSNKYYEQAQKCFEFAGETSLAQRAQAYTLANKATQMLLDLEAIKTEVSTSSKKMTRQLKKELKMKESLASSLFAQAGDTFVQVSKDLDGKDSKRLLKEAARCYSSGKVYAKAAEYFRVIGLYGQAAETEMLRGNYEEAGEMFLKKDEYIRAIEAFKLAMNWDKLVKTIYLYRNKMGFEERQKYIHKYMPAALEELTPKLEPSAEQETNYRKQIHLETKNIIIEDSDESSEDEQDEPEEKELDASAGLNKEEINKQPLAAEPSTFKTEANEKSESNLSLLQDSQSFVLLSQENSFSLLSDKIEDIDPDDEWLQLETGSVVESLDSVINPDGSITSDFSLLEPSTSGKITGKLIKTRCDIFAEDTTMRKIIEYISMFSEDVSSYLQTLRSSPSLVSSQVFKQDWELASLIDLDDISPQMLGLLLDVLEEFGMYRLSLIVCNRYNLVERAGRFIVSLAFKYSNLSLLTYISFKLNNKEQVQRAAIAFTALHNVFEMINPEYLTTANSSHLGFEVFQTLVLLGYWKKVVFLLQEDESRALMFLFNDLEAFAKIACESQAEGEGIGIGSLGVCLDWKDKESLLNFVVGLELVACRKILNRDLDGEGFVMELVERIDRNQSLKEFALRCAKVVRRVFDIGDEESKSKSKGEEVDAKEALDAIMAWAILIGQLNGNLFFEELMDSSAEDFEQVLITCNYLMKFLDMKYEKVLNRAFVRHCILSPAGMRIIPDCKITSNLPTKTHSIIHISSPLISNFNKSSLYALDLEGQIYLTTNTEVSRVYKEWVQSSISYIIQSRKRNNSTLPSNLNSIGEIWFGDFMFSKSPYNLMSYQTCISHVSQSLIREYERVKEQLAELKGEDFSDVRFNKYMVMVNEKKVKKLKVYINKIEKEIENSNFNERYNFIDNVLSKTKFYLKDDLSITRTTKQALLTYIQIFVVSSEEEVNVEKRDRMIWMAFEMARISGQMIYFIEMMRCRNRLVIRGGRKVAKVSNVYHNAIGLADISVYMNLNCFDSLAETILDLLETLELDDSLKIFYLRLSTIAWCHSYSSTIHLPTSFKIFKLLPGPYTENKGKLRISLLEKLCSYFSFYSTVSIPDSTKIKYVNHISDCLSIVIYHIQKDNQVADIIRKLQKNSSFLIGKSLALNHVLFKLIEEFPNFKTKLGWEKFEISHKEYPDDELERAWIVENKNIMIHQNLANKIRIARKEGLVCVSQIGRIAGNSELIETLYRYLADLYHCLYRVTLFKSLDLHYLLDQIAMVSRMVRDVDKCEMSVEQVRNEIKALEIWKIHVKPASEKLKQKLKKKWNVKWKMTKKSK